ncbi:MAG TPA: hypothetical protein VF711_09685, partial [Acidimicrobiales bacterium]
MNPALALAAGALVGCGVFLLITGLRRAPRTDVRALAGTRTPDQDRRLLQFVAGVAVALVVVLMTGRPVGAILAGGIALSLPSVFGG